MDIPLSWKIVYGLALGACLPLGMLFGILLSKIKRARFNRRICVYCKDYYPQELLDGNKSTLSGFCRHRSHEHVWIDDGCVAFERKDR
jgi:hypothetical protein